MRAHTLVILSLTCFPSPIVSNVFHLFCLSSEPFLERSKGYFKRVFCAPATTAPGSLLQTEETSQV